MSIAQTVLIAGVGPDGTPQIIEVTANGELQVVNALIQGIDNPVVMNQTLTVANTEYAVGLPGYVRYFEFQCRSGYDVRYAFATGQVATPIAPYFTLKAEDYYYSGLVNLPTGLTLYFASASAGVAVELLLDIYSVSRPPVVVSGPNGIESMETSVEDVEGAKTGSTLITHTYYPGGETDVITVANRDAADAVVTEYVIKHYTDGRQPILTPLKVG